MHPLWTRLDTHSTTTAHRRAHEQAHSHAGALSSGGSAALGEMLAGYDATARYYEGALAGAARDPEGAARRLLPMAGYIGRLEEPELALKREAQLGGAGRIYYPYYPAATQAPAEAAGGPSTQKAS